MTSSIHDPRAIRDPRAIEALASPVRQELIDTLYVLGGTATAAALADALGHHADGLYYHLRVLCDVGLIDEIAATQGKERTFRLTGDTEAPLRLAYENGPGGNTEALMTYVSGLLKVAGKDFEQAIAAPDTIVDGDSRQLWASRNKGWLSTADIEEVNVLLERLCSLVSQTRSGKRDTLMTLAFVLAPSMARAKRR